MKNEFQAVIRREQTTQQLAVVSQQIKDELATLGATDELGLHKTQFDAVRTVLHIAISELQTHLNALDVKELDLEDVYDACREFDEATIWLQRFWSYLKEKFDQRKEPAELASLLKAADEVVWSCFHSVLERALGKHGPAPLTYIEPEYSPATIQTEKPLPASLYLEADLEFLDQCLEKLPVPILRLPPTCISSPWWLIFIGHEIGHHVQYALSLVRYFREGLVAAAESKNFSAADAALTWGNWGEEIFADVFSILMMGQFALRAMFEMETGSAEKMVKRKANYPSPVVRLALMKDVAEKLGLKVNADLLSIDLAAIANSDPVAAKDYAVVPAAVEFALRPLPDGRLLSELCGFNTKIFADDGRLRVWCGMLGSEGDVVLDKNEMLKLTTARDIVCGSMLAWMEHADGTDKQDEAAGFAERTKLRERIRNNTVNALLSSGPRETRTGQAPQEWDSEKTGKELARLLESSLKRFSGKEKQGAVQG